MKVKVLSKFRNKFSKRVHLKGEEIEVSEDRFKEVNGAGHGKLLEKVEEKENKDKKEDNKKKQDKKKK